MYVPGFTPEMYRSNAGYMPASPEIMGNADPSLAVPSPRARALAVSDQGSRSFGSNIATAAAAANTARAAAANPLPPGLMFKTDKGASAGYGKGSSGYVAFDPNAQYRMWDERGKNKIVSSGTGETGLRSIYELANQFNTEQGKKANYGIERLNPATGKWERILENDPAKNIVGKIADIGLPILGAALMPLTGGLSGALAAGLGAAGGSVLSSVAQGRSLKDTLLRGGITGLTAGALSAGGNAIGGALGGAGGGAGSSTAGLLATGGILPTVGGGFSATLAGGVGGALGGGAAGAIGNEILVQGVRQGVGGGLTAGLAGGALGGGLAGALPGMAPGQGTNYADRVFDQQGNEITVTAPRPTPLPGGAIGAGVGAGLPTVINGPNGNEMILEGTRPTPPERNPPYPGDVPINLNTPPQISTVPVTPVQTPPVGTAAGDGRGVSVIDALRAAGLLTGLVGSAFGGGGGSGNGVIPPGFGGGFGDTGGLPAANLPGLAPGTAGQRDTSGTDWYRYGYGPSQSFFNYVPQGAANTSQAYTGYAEGGVAGEGTGRSDEIPALLSDGEYIIDAETVALLGDGSTKAGAERLDAFRVNVRKHKGRELAKGGFSADARDPMHYLKGGRT